MVLPILLLQPLPLCCSAACCRVLWGSASLQPLLLQSTCCSTAARSFCCHAAAAATACTASAAAIFTDPQPLLLRAPLFCSLRYYSLCCSAAFTALRPLLLQCSSCRARCSCCSNYGSAVSAVLLPLPLRPLQPLLSKPPPRCSLPCCSFCAASQPAAAASAAWHRGELVSWWVGERVCW